MRFLKAFILLVALFAVSIKGQTYTTDVNAFIINGGPGNVCGATGDSNRITESVDGVCTQTCGGNYFKVTSDRSTYPARFTLLTYSSDNTTCQTPQYKSSPFSCPIYDPASNTRAQFNVPVSDSISYNLQCVHQVVSTETPAAGNSADKVAVSIAIIFGALISLLAL